jgi:hypothetical protein
LVWCDLLVPFFFALLTSRGLLNLLRIIRGVMLLLLRVRGR